jgi:5'(3')-deoxyribonucleotidase
MKLRDLYIRWIVMTDCKSILNGDILIDSNNDTKDNFEGEVIRIGSIEFPDWKSILKYLDTDDKHQ